jgi:hypothetical protein
MKSQFIKAALLMALAFSLPLASQADVCVPTDPDFDQVLCDLNGGGGGGPGGGGAPPSGVPVDGGASLLLAAGVGYAMRRFRKQDKTQAAA